MGDALDWRRVEGPQRPRLLRLRAEMLVRDSAWLELSVMPRRINLPAASDLRAVRSRRPPVLDFYNIIFGGMRDITGTAEGRHGR